MKLSKPIQTNPYILALVEKSIAAVKAMSPENREAMYAAQRRSWVRGEMAMGSDADEARYRAAGTEERKRIDAELQARADRLVPRGTESF
jgi:hypothetical protein